MLKRPTWLTGLCGHIGLYDRVDNTLTAEDRDTATLITRISGNNATDCVLRVMALPLPTASFVSENRTHFAIYGYSYSGLVETAKYLNCSLWVNAFTPKSGLDYDEMKYLLVKYLPHVYLPPIWPQTLFFGKLIIDGHKPLQALGIDRLAEPSAMLWFVRLDHVLARTRHVSYGLLHIVQFFDLATAILLILSALVLPMLSWLVQKLLDRVDADYFRSLMALDFRRLLWLYWVALVTDNVDSPRHLPRYARQLLLVWSMALFTLRIFFADNMVGFLAAGGHDLNIDSLDELFEEKSVKLMAVSNHIEENAPYFDPDSEFGKDFNARFLPLTVKLILDTGFMTELVARNIVPFRAVMLAPKDGLNYYANLFDGGKYRSLLHVSAAGGESQPNFFPVLFPTKTPMKKAIDTV